MPYHISAAEYSLHDLYRLALERSETIQIAREELYISEQKKDKAVSEFLPAISAFGNHTRYNEEKRSAISIVQPDYSNSWGIRLDRSVSLGGREINSYRMSKDGIIKSRYDLDAVKEDYLLSVASAYYNVLKAKKAMDIADVNVERLAKHRDAAKIRLKVGEAVKTEVLRAEAELAGAQSDAVRAENSIKLAKATLAKTAGIIGDYDVKESQESQRHKGTESEDVKNMTVNCQMLSVDCLRQTALSERAELKAFIIENRIAENGVAYAKGSYLPNISVEGVYSSKEDHPSSVSALRETIYGGLKIDFPIFEGGLRMAEVREAKAKLRQTGYRLSDLKNSISVEVENAYLALITESGVITNLEAQVAYATDNYNAVSKQFEHGLANSVDVMDANTLLVTAQRKLSDARFNYQLALLRLKRATGTLLKTVSSKE